jgi:hypothetical protein
MRVEDEVEESLEERQVHVEHALRDLPRHEAEQVVREQVPRACTERGEVREEEEGGGGHTLRLELPRGVQGRHLRGSQGSAESQEDREAVSSGEGGLQDRGASHAVHRVQCLRQPPEEVGVGLRDDPVLPGEGASGGEVKLAARGNSSCGRGQHQRTEEWRPVSMSTTVMSLRRRLVEGRAVCRKVPERNSVKGSEGASSGRRSLTTWRKGEVGGGYGRGGGKGERPRGRC